MQKRGCSAAASLGTKRRLVPPRDGTADSGAALPFKTGKQPMFHNAFALFFLAALAGSAAALQALVRTNLKLIASALRGDPLPSIEERQSPRLIRVVSGRRLAFAPVRFRICRL